MHVQFSPQEFTALKQGFQFGDPSGDYAPDEMPVPIDVVEQVRDLLGASNDGILDLDQSQASVLEACFMVGTESNLDIADVDYDAILAVLRSASAPVQV
jgi:hypothetical protein